MTMMFSQIDVTFLNDIAISSKKSVKFSTFGGLQILKKTHFFLEKLISEYIHSLNFGSYLAVLLQIKPFQTYSVRPPPNLFLFLLALISQPSKLN